MPRFVAFLRAINVGGRTVRMTRLRDLFIGLGFSNVETFIASGNVVFSSKSVDAAGLERKIARALAADLGYDVATFVRTDRELAAIADHTPFKDRDLATGARVHVGFLQNALDAKAAAKLHGFTTPIDEFHLNGRELYWLCRKNQSESTFSNAVLERTLGGKATFRNVNTVRRMAAKYCASSR